MASAPPNFGRPYACENNVFLLLSSSVLPLKNNLADAAAWQIVRPVHKTNRLSHLNYNVFGQYQVYKFYWLN